MSPCMQQVPCCNFESLMVFSWLADLCLGVFLHRLLTALLVLPYLLFWQYC